MSKGIRKGLAKDNYLNPRSSTFGNKAASLRKAGYSASYAESFGSKVLADVEVSDKVIASFKEFVEDLPDLMKVTRKKIKQLIVSKDNISAKDYVAVLKQIEMVAGWAGMFKKTIEKRVETVMIGIPRQICRKCGNIMDYMKQGEGRTAVQE